MSRLHSLRCFTLVSMFLFSIVCAPMAVVVQANSTQTQPTAFLPSWNLSTPTAYYPMTDGTGVDEIQLLHLDDPSTYGYDELGNFYVAMVEDYGSIGDYTASYRGIHIAKFDPNGTLVWGKNIQSNNYCQYDYQYCTIAALHIIGVDEFYLVASTYYVSSLTFDSSLSLSLSGHQLIVAYHDSNGWSWAEATSTPSYAYQYLLDNQVDSADNLILTLYEGQSGTYNEFTIKAYSTQGGKWNRQLETYYDSTFPLMTLDGTDIHFMALTKNNLRYDSQSTSCPIGSEQEFCYIWVSLNTNGVRTYATSVAYPSVYFTTFSVNNSIASLYGNSVDFISNYDTATNFTGTMTSTNTSTYAGVLASLDSNGWIRHSITGVTLDEGDGYSLNTAYFNSDGSGILYQVQTTQDVVFDGINVREHPNLAIEYSIIGFDAQHDYLWHTGIAADGIDAFRVSEPHSGYMPIWWHTDSNSQYISYPYAGSSVSTPYSVLLWVSESNGTILDSEATTGFGLASSPEGGLMTFDSFNDKIEYFMPDLDGDNFGTNDNCPTVYNPTQDDYNSNTQGDACDDDDDSDTILDGSDLCPLGELDWTSSTITDHDADGCRDSSLEDGDDDNDGHSDTTDACPVGITGAGNDFDVDGCKDSEDNDDDNDGVSDGSDSCSQGELGWSSGTVTDHDSDGCRDTSEDSDDDNDGVTDVADSCPTGSTNWPSNLNTDFDADGCKDSFEDEDNDGDGVPNPSDDCPFSTTMVDESGCSAAQNIDGNEGNSESSTTVYYVCQQGSIVVTDLADCPDSANNSNASEQSGNVTEFFFVCPGGTSVVSDMADCPEGLPSTSNQNITYILNPNSSLSDDFTVCPGGTVIVMDEKNCPTTDDSSSESAIQSTNDASSSTDTLVLLFAGGAFIMAMGAVIIVLVRRPVQSNEGVYSNYDTSESLFKEQPHIPEPTVSKAPPITMKGSSRDGYEWIEWPPNTDQHWYRADDSRDEWSLYQQ